MELNIIILAAGQGKRMQSSLPKPLHCIGGIPLLQHVLTTACSLNPQQIFVVYGHEGLRLQQAFADWPIHWIEQEEQLGTGHAVAQVLPYLDDNARVLILYGDVPLIHASTLQNLLAATQYLDIAWLTAYLPNPYGFGRILRDKQGQAIAIIEDKETNAKQKAINEVNTGICALSASYLKAWLPSLKNNNSQGEYYLTDIFALAVKEKVTIHTLQPDSTSEIIGINDKKQLALLERLYQEQKAEELLMHGVTLLDYKRLDIRGNVCVGRDVTIDVNVIFEGSVYIGNNCYIGPNTLLRNVSIADNVTIEANCVIEDATIANDCKIGPFARLRPGTKIDRHAKVGNFVEIKNSEIGENSKVNHLSYIGDSTLGKHVNIGAGTITCNYDGVNKHRTTIEDNAFIGSNTALVAPITIGKDATIGAGSTINRSAPAGELTLSRAKQTTINGWKRPRKKTDNKGEEKS